MNRKAVSLGFVIIFLIVSCALAEDKLAFFENPFMITWMLGSPNIGIGGCGEVEITQIFYHDVRNGVIDYGDDDSSTISSTVYLYGDGRKLDEVIKRVRRDDRTENYIALKILYGRDDQIQIIKKSLNGKESSYLFGIEREGNVTTYKALGGVGAFKEVYEVSADEIKIWNTMRSYNNKDSPRIKLVKGNENIIVTTYKCDGSPALEYVYRNYIVISSKQYMNGNTTKYVVDSGTGFLLSYDVEGVILKTSELLRVQDQNDRLIEQTIINEDGTGNKVIYIYKNR